MVAIQPEHLSYESKTVEMVLAVPEIDESKVTGGLVSIDVARSFFVFVKWVSKILVRGVSATSGEEVVKNSESAIRGVKDVLLPEGGAVSVHRNSLDFELDFRGALTSLRRSSFSSFGLIMPPFRLLMKSLTSSMWKNRLD